MFYVCRTRIFTLYTNENRNRMKQNNQKTNEPRCEKNRLFAYAKTKTQISFAITAKLISVFVFAITDSTIPLLLISKISSL